MLSQTTETEFDPRWVDLIEPEWIEQLNATPFLRRCRSGEVSNDEMKTFAVQQYFYSRHFTRYLCALLSNITNEADRRELTENLIDEAGMGSKTGIPHSTLYRSMLEKLDLDVDEHQPFPETLALVETMLQSCRNPNAAVGLGALCLGAEAIVPLLYKQIVHGFEAVGQPKETLDFFYLHIECDDEHAVTMKNIIERELTAPEHREALRCAAARVIAARTRFFTAVKPNREKGDDL